MLDDATAAKLQSVNERIELCDARGRTIGFYDPINGRKLPRDKNCQSPYTREELEQFRNEPGGKPLAEILKRLQDQ
jgi:hypothetical protein